MKTLREAINETLNSTNDKEKSFVYVDPSNSHLAICEARNFISRVESAIGILKDIEKLMNSPVVDGEGRLNIVSPSYDFFDGQKIKITFCKDTGAPLCAKFIKED